MKIFTQRITGIIICCSFLLLAKGQDPVFSQYFANRMYLNPALTAYDFNLSVNLNKREQWALVRQGRSKFTTQAAGVSLGIPRVGSAFGLSYLEHQEGEGQLRTQTATFSYGFSPLMVTNNGNDLRTELLLGLSGSLTFRSLDWSRLVFSDQLDPIYGLYDAAGVYRQSNYLPPLDFQSNAAYADAHAGAVLRHVIHPESKKRRSQLVLGLAAHHLARPQDALLSTQPSGLPIRWTGEGSYTWERSYNNLSREELVVQWSLLGKYDMQRRGTWAPIAPGHSIRSFYQSLDVGMGWDAYFRHGAGLYLAGFFRSQLWRTEDQRGNLDVSEIHSVVTSFGISYEVNGQSYQGGVSYDLNIGGLGGLGGGAWEFSLIATIPSNLFGFPKSYTERNRMRCPVRP